jgi:hypothetical protein
LKQSFDPENNHMLPTRRFFVTRLVRCLLVFPTALVNAHGQTTASTDPRQSLKAALILTPEFCATTFKKRIYRQMQTFEVGKDACAELEPALKAVFPDLSRLMTAPQSGEVQIVLLPRIIDAHPTSPAAFTGRTQMVVLLEWTAMDASGKPVWIETLQGTAEVRQHYGFSGITLPDAFRRGLEQAVEDVAKQSAAKMSSAPEFRKPSAQ